MPNIATLRSPAVVDALAAVDGAITQAYDLTRADLQSKRLDRRIEKTWRPQQLHHNINQQICDVGGMYPGLVTDLPPNRRRSHHHVIVSVENVLMRVSAVPAPDRTPRLALHRSRFAICQTYFRMGESGLEIVPVPNPYDDEHSLYIHVLHGPQPGEPSTHGFTVVRVLDIDDKYLPNIIDLGEHLALVAGTQTNIEHVTEDFQVTVLVPEGVNQIAFW